MLCPTLLISMPGGEEWIIIILIFIPLYFLPSIIAHRRKNPDTPGIFILNLLLGFTVIGWIGALVWAFSSGSQMKRS